MEKASTVPKSEGENLKVVRILCDRCHCACGVLAYVRDGKVVKVEGDPNFPLSFGDANLFVEQLRRRRAKSFLERRIAESQGSRRGVHLPRKKIESLSLKGEALL